MGTPVRILGIDPGLRHTGWGMILSDGPRLSWVAHGVISPDPNLPLAERLAVIFNGVSELVSLHQPHLAGVEETLVNAGAQSALKLGQARGAAMTALAVSSVEVSEFAPRRIKQAIVGTGKADKEQIAFMVQRLLPRAGGVKNDAADALATAICAAHYRPALVRGVA
ncbi:crossover junction endodeoxyribonuclease RuvC [Ponticaulis sp.]|uniref:crossover junction endodeoxyribonuclease RuvC n=1 Tax=Ponticaulis sp. TaxID=2020902 RepID=UPI000C3777FB|nr:crossover junction endodeoxyribonuclease RuvC [Ponticaulis sp.]MBN02789.1 crossover junction endodeoxyribonuclease RuvC [Ponticaulis sp.]|tara:strand:+ start:363 stop:863 length:501 start_codon:yes stop_codon:yes gene_type:complete